MEFFSHPNKPLKEHLKNVGNFMEGENILKGKFPEKFLYYVGLSHDFGKYTTYFQRYLKEGRKDKNNLHHHSLLSAYFTAWLLREKYDEGIWPILGFLVVLNHHKSLEKSKFDLNEQKFKYWINDLRKNSERISEELDIDISGFLETDVRELKEYLEEMWYKLSNKRDKKIFFLVSYVFSLLIDGDKRDAVGIGNADRGEIPADIVDNYIKSFPKGGINKKRMEFYEDVIGVLNNYNDEKFIFVNAPTGIGKTLANLSLALKLRKRFSERKPRIVYVLPFVSIIEQTYEVFYDVFSRNVKDFKGNEEKYLLKHHHLADLRYRQYGEDASVDEALLLTEGWESEVIITTFVQFFETVIGRRNTMLKKFHNLAGSIVILDEIQNIDAKWWKLIEESLTNLSEIFGNVFIISTATKPLIFINNESHICATNYKKYTFNRTCIEFREDVDDVEKLKREVLSYLEKENNVMVILNTINLSIDFYNGIKEKARELGFKTFYLSTNIVPKHRLHRIKEIKECLGSGEKVMLVSTQVVEAGVDIDFGLVVRDIGPLDSIIQVAGRCNREGKRDLGRVVVVNLKDEGTFYSSKVYGSILTESSQRVLKGRICEEEYFDLVEEYFKVVSCKISNKDSEEVLEAIARLEYKTLDNFKVVKEEPYTVDVFIQVDERGKCVFEKFINDVLRCEDRFERYRNFLKLRKDIRDYLISIPETYAKNLDECEGLKFVSLERLSDHYNIETGFKRDSRGFEVW